MKKIASFLLVLALCVSILAVSLQTFCSAAESDQDPVPTVSIIPGDPDLVNTVPPREDLDDTE